MTEQLQIMGTVGIAMLLGGIIGLEREVADKPAGLRTHMLAILVLVFLGFIEKWFQKKRTKNRSL